MWRYDNRVCCASVRGLCALAQFLKLPPIGRDWTRIVTQELHKGLNHMGKQMLIIGMLWMAAGSAQAQTVDPQMVCEILPDETQRCFLADFGTPPVTYTKTIDFAQVFLGSPNAANDYLAFLSLVSPSTSQIVRVTVWSEVGGPFVYEVRLTPGARRSVRLDTLSQLRGIQAVTMRVEMPDDGIAGVAMHPAHDFWRATIQTGTR